MPAESGFGGCCAADGAPLSAPRSWTSRQERGQGGQPRCSSPSMPPAPGLRWACRRLPACSCWTRRRPATLSCAPRRAAFPGSPCSADVGGSCMSSCVPLTAPLADVRTSQCFVKSCSCASTNYPLPASLYTLCAHRSSASLRVLSRCCPGHQALFGSTHHALFEKTCTLKRWWASACR